MLFLLLQIFGTLCLRGQAFMSYCLGVWGCAWKEVLSSSLCL